MNIIHAVVVIIFFIQISAVGAHFKELDERVKVLEGRVNEIHPTHP